MRPATDPCTYLATLWGLKSNVLTVLDINVWQNNRWWVDENSNEITNNAQFGINVANWIAGDVTAVPEPSTLATGLFALVAGVLVFGKQQVARARSDRTQ